jgi:hypothetical protein
MGSMDGWQDEADAVHHNPTTVDKSAISSPFFSVLETVSFKGMHLFDTLLFCFLKTFLIRPTFS